MQQRIAQTYARQYLTSMQGCANGNEVDVLQWWSSIYTKHPGVYKMAMSALSIFCAPKVESRFNTVGDTIDKKSN